MMVANVGLSWKRDMPFVTLPTKPAFCIYSQTQTVTVLRPQENINCFTPPGKGYILSTWLVHVWHDYYEWVMPRMNESCHVGMSHVVYEQVFFYWHSRLCCSVVQCVAVCCSVLQCVAVCCSVLQCVAVCCSVLQCVAVCCRMMPSFASNAAVCTLYVHACVCVRVRVRVCVRVCVGNAPWPLNFACVVCLSFIVETYALLRAWEKREKEKRGGERKRGGEKERRTNLPAHTDEWVMPSNEWVMSLIWTHKNESCHIRIHHAIIRMSHVLMGMSRITRISTASEAIASRLNCV